jgi:ethanolamine permease
MAENAGYVKESDATTEEIANRKLKLRKVDIWALGITIVIGGQYFSWNAGYAAGFGSYLISTVLIGTSYICLCVCNAEISSALPFAGGAYGLARVSLGMYPGFIIGCLEAGEYIVYVASSAIALAMMIISLSNSSNDLLPIICLIFYISALMIHLPGGRIFWTTNAFLAFVSIGFIIIYIFGSIPSCNFAVNAPTPQVTGSVKSEWFVGGFVPFLSAMPLAAWFYVGVESLNLAAAFVDEVNEMPSFVNLDLFAYL